jgi:hypothetical protein
MGFAHFCKITKFWPDSHKAGGQKANCCLGKSMINWTGREKTGVIEVKII